jgi:hypothetical protein
VTIDTMMQTTAGPRTRTVNGRTAIRLSFQRMKPAAATTPPPLTAASSGVAIELCFAIESVPSGALRRFEPHL